MGSEIKYIQHTRGSVTASKLKAYLLAPAYFNIKYNKEIVPEQAEEDTKSLFLGDAFHYIMEMGSDAFLEKYTISEGFLKKDLAEMIIKRASDSKKNTAEIESLTKWCNSTKTTLFDLRVKRYGQDYIEQNQGKLELTQAEGRDLIGMYESAIKQPLFDWGSYYIKEQRFEAEYKKMNLSFKPDRIMFYTTQDDGQLKKAYTLEEINKLLLDLDREEQKKLIAKMGLKGLIRDFKTTGNLAKLKREILNNGETKYNYIVSMSYYFTLIYVIYSIKCDVYLDAIESVYPYFPDVIQIPRSMLEERFKRTIVPTLDKMSESFKMNVRPEPDRESILNNKDMKLYAPYFSTFIQDEPTVIDLDM